MFRNGPATPVLTNDPAVQGFTNMIGGGHAPSAVLWIFTPRYISPQSKRPLTYNFNQQFVNAADEAVSRASQLDPMQLKLFVSRPQYLSSMYAASVPAYTVDMRQLSASWTFMLVANNDKTGPTGSLNSMSDNQILYYGHFIGEPINPLQHMGRQTFDPNAQMIVTHKTIINKQAVVGGSYERTLHHTMTDVDIIHPAIMGPLTSTGLSLIRPEDLYPATTDGPDMIVMGRPETSLIERQGEPIGITSRLSVPRHNIETVLQSVAEARGAITSDKASGGSNVISLGRDSFRSLVEMNLQDNTRLSMEIGMPTNVLITLSSVIARYNPRIESVRLDRDPRYIPADQTVVHPRNAFSSMLTTIVPAIMAEFLLIDFGFYYNSHTEELKLFDSCYPVCPMSQESIKFQIVGFIHRLKSDVFPILKSRGDFILNMQCSCGGISQVNLNFLDDSIITKDIFDVPTILGGLNSSLLGDNTTFDWNAKELGQLIGNLVDTDSDGPPLSHYDDRRFKDSLSRYDSTQPQHPSQQFPQNNNNRWGI